MLSFNLLYETRLCSRPAFSTASSFRLARQIQPLYRPPDKRRGQLNSRVQGKARRKGTNLPADQRGWARLQPPASLTLAKRTQGSATNWDPLTLNISPSLLPAPRGPVSLGGMPGP